MSIQSKLQAIKQGYTNYIFPTPTMEALANERSKICAGCDKCEPNAILKVVMPDKSLSEIQGAKCKECGCPLSAKVRQVLENCPLEKW